MNCKKRGLCFHGFSFAPSEKTSFSTQIKYPTRSFFCGLCGLPIVFVELNIVARLLYILLLLLFCHLKKLVNREKQLVRYFIFIFDNQKTKGKEIPLSADYTFCPI